MSYGFAVPGDLQFNGERAEQQIARTWRQAGVAIHTVPTGDTSASYTYYQGPYRNGQATYAHSDVGIWYYVGYADPTYTLDIATEAQWGNYNDTGYANPAYDSLFQRQARTVDQARRRAIVWQMEALLAHDRPYIPLVDLTSTMATRTSWTGANPNLYGYPTFIDGLHPAG